MKNVADYLSDLIRVPSPSAVSNRPVIEYASAVLEKAGWRTQEVTYADSNGIEKVNLIAAPSHQRIDAAQVALACVCHTDTVPFSAAWQNALIPYEDDGFVFGCGACDVKGFLACLLAAATETDSSNISQDVRIVLTADEEIGCIGAHHLVKSGLLQPRRMVIGEPTSLRPALAGKGYALAEVCVHGVEAHSALPHQGESAILAAAALIAELENFSEQLSKECNPLFTPPYTSLNIGVIQGGTAKNVIAGSCRFLVEWRPVPGQDPHLVYRKLQQLAADVRVRRPRIQIDVTLLRIQSGFQSSPDDPLVVFTTNFCQSTPTSIAFGSEASLFAAEGRDIIVFGPGDMECAHSDRERVPIAELRTAVQYLTKLFLLADFVDS